MIIECPSCKSTYANTERRAGTTLPCLCGAVLSFPPLPPEGDPPPNIQPLIQDPPPLPHRATPSFWGVLMILVGLAFIVAGIVMTKVTYEGARTMGNAYYYVYWGHMAVGAVIVICGLIQIAVCNAMKYSNL